MVTMLADHYSEDWETLWWVRANRRATILAGQRQMAGPWRLLANRCWQYRQVPVVTAERRTGWAGSPRPGSN